MKIYVVTEEGRFRHDILGIFHNPGAAECCAESAAALSDGYHEYDVNAADEDKAIDDVIPLVGYRKVSGKVNRVVKQI